MDARLVREGSGVYIVVPRQTEDYREKMLMECACPHLLSMSLKNLDGNSSYCYDIKARQSLEQIYSTRDMDTQALRELMTVLMQTVDTLGEYLISPDALLLSPEYVMVGPKGRIGLCCDPSRSDRQGRIRLGEFVINHTDTKDEAASVLAWGFYEALMDENYDLSLLLSEPDSATDAPDFIPPAEEKDPETSDRSFYYGDPEDEEEDDPVTDPDTIKVVALCCLLILAAGGAYVYIFLHPQLLTSMGMKQEDYILAGAVVTAVLSAVMIALIQVFIHKKAAGESEKDEGCRMAKSEMIIDDDLQPREPKPEKDDDTGEETVILTAADENIPSGQEGEKKACLMGIVGNENLRIELSCSPFRVGKAGSENDFALKAPGISRLHAVFERSAAGWFVSDVNSTNGTKVNSHPLTPGDWQALVRGDEIEFGEYRFVFIE